jgi:hypothetical protein
LKEILTREKTTRQFPLLEFNWRPAIGAEIYAEYGLASIVLSVKLGTKKDMLNYGRFYCLCTLRMFWRKITE